MLLQLHEPGATPTPHEAADRLAIGIDLGTTNSVVAIALDGKPEVLRDAKGRSLVPSVVAYPKGGPVIVGEEARRLLLDEPDAVVSSIKRLMGRGESEVKALAGTLPYRLDSSKGGMVRLELGGRSLTPVEISADILKRLKAIAEEHLDRPVQRAVITVPAYFDDAARLATKDAARLAGLEPLRLVNEPTAAALAYGLDKGAEGLYAIYDLGGGTFDISLLKLEKGIFQVLATGGDAQLGGDDFDHLVAEAFLAERGKETLSNAEVKQVLQSARLAKECLSTQDEGEWRIEVGGRTTRHRLDRVRLESLIRPLVERTLEISRGVLADAGIGTDRVKGVVLVGGSTRLPLVRRMVGALFGTEPLSDIDPDEVVALGAALQAEALTVGSDTLLLDVLPLSLGIETMGGIVEKLIHRNTPIPVAMAQEVTTYQDGQSAMLIHVLQGERETVDSCRSLARFELRGIPPMVAGAARVRITFTVDADGLLTVAAREKTTGIEQRVEVKPTYGLSEDEMATMLRQSLEHAKEDMERRLVIEAQVEARRVLMALAAALRADPGLVEPGERARIEKAERQLELVVEGKDRDAIKAGVEDLEEASRAFAERRMDKAIRGALAGHNVEEYQGDPGGCLAPEAAEPAETHQSS